MISAINEQLEKMRKGEFTETEFSSSIRSIKSSFRSVTDKNRGMNSFYLSRFIAGVDMSPWEAEAEMDNITREDVISCAKNITVDTVYFLEGGAEE